MTANYPLVDSVESFEKALAQVRAAQKTFATYTQEQVDQIFQAAAIAAKQAAHSPGQNGRAGNGHGRGGGQGHQEPVRRRVHLQRL